MNKAKSDWHLAGKGALIALLIAVVIAATLSVSYLVFVRHELKGTTLPLGGN